MLPGYSANNSTYGGSTDFVFGRERTDCFAVGIFLANQSDVSFSNTTAPDAAAVNLPAFGPHVAEVLQLSSEKQMRWIDASRCIATMTDLHPFRNRSVVELERETMRSTRSSSATNTGTPVPRQPPISRSIETTYPQPVLCRYVADNAHTEPDDRWRTLYRHRRPRLCGVSPRVLRHAGGTLRSGL